jgi:hypothetical protein
MMSGNPKLRGGQAHGVRGHIACTEEAPVAAIPRGGASRLHPQPDVLAFSVLETAPPFARVPF